MKRLAMVTTLAIFLIGCSSNSVPTTSSAEFFVGSANSTVYHYSSCKWAENIKPVNEVWFSSAEEAQDEGYRPCKTCKPPQ